MRLLFSLILLLFSSQNIFAASQDQKCVLVVGGAGYIGSYVNEMLVRAGYKTIILDNLSCGSRDTVLHGTFIEGDISNKPLLDELFSSNTIDAVMHFAAYKDVGESVQDPIKYYINNVSGTLTLLDAMVRHQVKVFVFSSSASIFGTPTTSIITEDHPCNPENPYGQTKLMVETILRDLNKAYGLRFSCLRYFNAAGADPEGLIKVNFDKTHNLIPVILRAIKDSKPVTIFGSDYNTSDGTCVRDYIHIEDLGEAHIAALKALLNGASSSFYNLGNERGYTVREVITAASTVTGSEVKIIEGSRRQGDPSIVVASSAKARNELHWKPLYPSLEVMIEHSLKAMKE